jgi:hypothetical protein
LIVGVVAPGLNVMNHTFGFIAVALTMVVPVQVVKGWW